MSQTVDFDSEDAVKIRQAHIGREANIRGMAVLMYIQAGFLMLVAGLFTIGMAAITVGLLPDEQVNDLSSRVLPCVFALVGAAVCGLGYWFWCGAGDLRRLSRTGRPAGVTWAIFNLVNIPLGTLIGLLTLAMLLDAKAYRVLCPEYRDVVGKTPDIRYRWAILKTLLVCLFIVLAVVFSAAFAMVLADGWQ